MMHERVEYGLLIKIIDINGVLSKEGTPIFLSEVFKYECLEKCDSIFPKIINFDLQNFTEENIDLIKKEVGNYDLLFIIYETNDAEKLEQIANVTKQINSSDKSYHILIAINSKRIENIDREIEKKFKNLLSYMIVKNSEQAFQVIDTIMRPFSPQQMIGIDFQDIIEILAGKKFYPVQIKGSVNQINEIETLIKNIFIEDTNPYLLISVLCGLDCHLTLVSKICDLIDEKLGIVRSKILLPRKIEELEYIYICSFCYIFKKENEITITVLVEGIHPDFISKK